MEEDLPFIISESHKFCEIIKKCRPDITVPSGDTVKTDILKLYKEKQQGIKKAFQVWKFELKYNKI